MNDTNCAVDRAMQAQIDRLVTGELSEGDRRSVLAWLDEDVRRWRTCAIAFLEAQCWEASATDLPRWDESILARTASEGKRVLIDPMQPRHGGRRFVLAAAASLAIAFLSGVLTARLTRVLPTTPISHVVEAPLVGNGDSAEAAQPLIATVALRTNLDPSVPAQLQLPVVPGDGPAESALSDYERKQWERRGFELIEERRYLPARLPDGREVVVPVNKVHMRFKPVPVS